MPPPLPSSLSPHVCILPSKDLVDLLIASSLPPLPNVLQSFSPLPQVTTRTTVLTSVSHASFNLRFSDLLEIETACREDEQQRAARTIDWVSARINKRCAGWVEHSKSINDQDAHRTPWWDELRRCTEGDHVPSKTEGWNHPVAIIFAVSTKTTNPLQVITTLHSRPLEFPPWVDSNILRYTLIIHPQDSSLSDEEAGALFNAVKKQFGLHTYLLPLSLPATPPPPVPIPAPIPRLPPPPSDLSTSQPSLATSPLTVNYPSEPSGLYTIRMVERDIQQTARFAREFLVMSLLPWMEKCVIDWNEAFSSTRRLPSRLFSSTRRLFGSPSPSPVQGHNPLSSVSSLPPNAAPSSSVQGLSSAFVSPPSQQRRLAEFATILGDLKLAVTVWEALRKDGKGGSDILPLLLTPSPTSPLYASSALATLHLQQSDPQPQDQILALKYAIRWEGGITTSDFLNYPLEGDRWLVSAAGNAEEPPSALLLAHAALLSSKKKARRRSALWYFCAASRLEKCGIKPLTMFFLRRAHELYQHQPQKQLSPSFWDSEGRTPQEVYGIDTILSGIEHPLGRLLYTTGDVSGAVRFFLGLLRGSPGSLAAPGLQRSPDLTINEGIKLPGADKLFLEDFRVAYTHFRSTSRDSQDLADLKSPLTFCLTKQTHFRLQHEKFSGPVSLWEMREQQWATFSKLNGFKADLSSSGRACVNEIFWVDLVLQNPLDAEISLSNVSLIVQEDTINDPSSSAQFVEVEIIDDLPLGAKELRTVSIRVKSFHAASLVVTSVTYDFLGLLRTTESLAFPGRRLHDTIAQRQKPTYAPDVKLRIEVEEADHRLHLEFLDDEHHVLAQGERKELGLRFSNIGNKPIDEIWMVAGPEDAVWLGSDEGFGDTDVSEPTEIVRSDNTLSPRSPQRVVFPDSRSLGPSEALELPLQLHAQFHGHQELHLLLVYRAQDRFRSVRVSWHYQVHKILEFSAIANPCQSLDHLFLAQLELFTVSTNLNIEITQVTSISPAWGCNPIDDYDLGSLPPSQSLRLFFGVDWRGLGYQETLDFVSAKLQSILNGKPMIKSYPPSIDLFCSHISETTQTVTRPSVLELLHGSKRTIVHRALAQSHPHIPSQSYPYIFPLYNPRSIDFVVFWEMPLQRRSGYIIVSDLVLGAGHMALRDIIEEAESAKVKRSMYAETQRERGEIMEAIRESEWNTEMNPTVLTLQEPDALHHDFGRGPCSYPVTITIRNCSPTHRAQFTLRLDADPDAYPSSSTVLPPPYAGQLTFRDTLEPSKMATIRPSLWITRPGTYGLGGWCLETEVLENLSSSETQNRVRHRYRQTSSSADESLLVVCDIDT